MKLKDYFQALNDEGNVIAYFGDARLVKKLDRRFELRGGSDKDRAEARKWISLFMCGAVYRDR